MAQMRRLRQRVESGGFPLKRIGAGAGLVVLAVVLLVGAGDADARAAAVSLDDTSDQGVGGVRSTPS
ncbi:MAG: hypothetical protein IH806_00925 [Proteobacteria bacterium]|nr:hypothetical protein [Pseudomonadota bacterium]